MPSPASSSGTAGFAYIGLVVIIYVAGTMIYDGLTDPKLGLLSLLH